MKTLILSLFLSLPLILCKSQSVETVKKNITEYIDSLSHYSDALKKTKYSEKVEPLLMDLFNHNKFLANGKIHTKYINTYGTPYFFDKTILGRVTINNTEYDDIKLLYDIYNDQIISIVENNNGNLNQVILNYHFVNSFKLNQYHFIKIKRKSFSGFYELIYNGNSIIVIAKWKKNRKSELIGNKEWKFTKAQRELIVLNKTEHTIINNKNSLYSFLKLEKDKIRSIKKRKTPDLIKATNRELVDFFKTLDQ